MKSMNIISKNLSFKNNRVLCDDKNRYKEDLIDVVYLGKTLKISNNLLKDIISNDALYTYFIKLIKTSNTHLLIDELSIPISFIVSSYSGMNDERMLNILNYTSYDACKNHFYNEIYTYKNYQVEISELFEMLEFSLDEYHMFREETLKLTYDKDTMCMILRSFFTENNILSKFDFSIMQDILVKYNIPIDFYSNMSEFSTYNYKKKKYTVLENFLYNYVKMCEEIEDERTLYLEIIKYLNTNYIFYKIIGKELIIGNMSVDLNDITLKNNIALAHMNECIIGIVSPKSIDIHRIHETLLEDRLKDITVLMFKNSLKIENPLELKKCIAIFLKCIDNNLRGMDIYNYIKKIKEIIFYNYKTVKVYVIPKKGLNVEVLLEVNTFYYLIDKKANIIDKEKAKKLMEEGIKC